MSQRHSHSSIACFKACPLRYKLRYIDGLELRDAAQNAHHLAYGSAGHAGLEALYSLNYTKKKSESGEHDALKSPLEIASEFLIQGYPSQLDLTDRAKTQENGALMLAQYVERWREEDRNWRILSCETLDLESETGLDALRLDLVVENLEHGGIYGVDHKITGKSLGPWFWDRFNPNSQITSYIDHIQQKYGSCEGFIINAIGMQWLDEKKSNDANNVKWFSMDDPNRPWLAYSHHEERAYRGGPLGKAGPRMVAWGLTVAFERMVFNRSRDQIKQERESTQYWISEIESSRESEVYGFNTDACYSCEYRGGDVIGGICRPGYEWPKDTELILLSYRQVCREVMQLQCPSCGGTGVDDGWRKRIASGILDRTVIALPKMMYGQFTIEVQRCTRCKGVGIVDGPRCALDRHHKEEHADTVMQELETIDVEVTV